MEIVPLAVSALMVFLIVLLLLNRRPSTPKRGATLQARRVARTVQSPLMGQEQPEDAQYPILPMRRTSEFSYRAVPNSVMEEEANDFLDQVLDLREWMEPEPWEPEPREPLPAMLRGVRRVRGRVTSDPRKLPKIARSKRTYV